MCGMPRVRCSRGGTLYIIGRLRQQFLALATTRNETRYHADTYGRRLANSARGPPLAREPMRRVMSKSPEDIGKMRVAGRFAAEVLDLVSTHVRPGITTGELHSRERKSRQSAHEHGADDVEDRNVERIPGHEHERHRVHYVPAVCPNEGIGNPYRRECEYVAFVLERTDDHPEKRHGHQGAQRRKREV